ncbi:MAG: integrase, partial [Rhodospirillales bacterium]|nr:integrase [Rhodospirillales bacterium]
ESLPVIAKLLGHAQIQTTARYTHLTRDAVKDAAIRVAGDIAQDILPLLPSLKSCAAAGTDPGARASREFAL